MAISGFPIKASNSGTKAQNVEWFDDDITWDEDTPDDVLREIHIQFDITTSVIVQVTLDGSVFVPLNNNVELFGLATFTMFVTKDTLLNFRTADAAGVTMNIVVTAA